MKTVLFDWQTVMAPLRGVDTSSDAGLPSAGSVGHYVVQRKTTWDIINQMEFMQAIACMYTEPLLTMPARWSFTDEHLEWQLKRKKVARIQSAIQSMEEAIVNIAALTYVDNTPVYVQKLMDEAGTLWYEKKEKQLWEAISAVSDGGGIGNGVPYSAWSCTVRHILSEIQRHMLEPTVDGGVSWQLWQEVEVVHYLRERLARFLVESGIVQDRDSFTTVVGQDSYDLNTTMAEVKRVALAGVGLFPMDYWQADHGKPDWDQSNGTPYGYMENVEQLSLSLIPAPSTAGQTVSYHMIKSTPFDAPDPNDRTDPAADSTAELLAGYRLRIPAIFCWAVKYGVMADMLKKEGEANDPQRAEWCEQRFRDGVEIARMLVGLPLPGGKE